MADETTTAEGGQTDTTTETNSGAEGKTFTQADLDRLIDARMAKERQRAEAQMSKAKADAEKKAAEEAGNWQKLAEQYKTEAAQAAEDAKTARLQVLRRDIAATLNVPTVLADRLRGETSEEITADAKALLASLPKQGPPAGNAGAGSKQTGASDGKDMNAFIRAASGRAQ